MHTVFLVRLDALGSKFYCNLNPVMRIVSDHIAGDRMQSAAIIIAPSTGKDEIYNEQSVHEAVEEVENILKQQQWQLRVQRVVLGITEESLGGVRSRRPGFTIAWALSSDAKDPINKMCLPSRRATCSDA